MKSRLWRKLNREFYKRYRIIRSGNYYVIVHHYDFGWDEMIRDMSLKYLNTRFEQVKRNFITSKLLILKSRSKKHYIKLH